MEYFTKDVDTKGLCPEDVERYYKMENWDEVKAKAENRVSCHDCRFFIGLSKCSVYIGMYHKTCKDFKWW